MRINRHSLFAVLTISIVATAQEAPKSEPKELSDLRGSWTRARHQATEPIDRKYMESLSVMKLRFTKEGNLDAALAIQEELQRMRPPSLESQKTTGSKAGPNSLSDFSNVSAFSAWLKNVKWLASTGAVLQFLERDALTITKPNGEVIRYAVSLEKIGELSWNWSDGRKEVFTIAPNLQKGTAQAWGELDLRVE